MRLVLHLETVVKVDLVFFGTKAVLVQQGDSVVMDTSAGGNFSESTLPDSSVAGDNIKYSMSYEEALQNIGFLLV